MPLPPGHFLALDAAGLKALRALKGDPKRREHVQALLAKAVPPRALGVGDSWQFLQHLAQKPLFRTGQSLHKGQLCHLVLLDAAEVNSGLAPLPQDEAATRKAFLAIDEKAFFHRFVPFWVSDELHRDGVTTLLTAPRAAKVAKALTELRVFLDSALAQGLSPLFFANYHSF